MTQLSLKHKLLIVGERDNFNPEIRAVLDSFDCEIENEWSHSSRYDRCSVVIFSPDFVNTSLSKLDTRNVYVLSCSDQAIGDINLGNQFSLEQFQSSLNAAIEFHRTKLNLRKVEKLHLLANKERENLSAIGIALSAEKDLNKLLSLVLREGRHLGRCEGASLYLVEKNQAGERELVFKLTQNSKINFDFKETRFPLTNKSLAGYVALTGEILNIRDVYQLDESFPFSFDKSFDQKVSHRSKELLVLPMKNHKSKVIGVLQFVNNFGGALNGDSSNGELSNSDVYDESSSLGFSSLKQGLLEGLASQAAVAIDNSHLIENIQNLFEGFVSASVNAIESRDPVTSGHSFRVADLTTGLAKMLDKEKDGVHRTLNFNHEQIREIRYASLLHDFGKVGVKENVLLKANKLHASRYQYLELKIEWQKQMLEKKFYRQLLAQDGVKAIDDINNRNILELGLNNHSAYRDLVAELNKLEQYKKMLFKANQPSLMEENVADGLSHMADYTMHQDYPFSNKLINDSDFLSLSISKGSLTDSERIEIQSHVIHTQKFLERIPWTDELAAIPTIAGAHHEKLDGTGYPDGLQSNAIPVASKIMAIADIFDALTAQDRPYKKAVKLDLALDILGDEAKRGKLDNAMLTTFIESKVYQCVL